MTTPHAFALARMALGASLLGYFLGHWGEAAELARQAAAAGSWGGGGWVGRPETLWGVHASFGAGAMLAAGLLFGWRRRGTALWLLAWWAWCGAGLLGHPALPLAFVGLALVWVAAPPRGEAWSREPARPDFCVPRWAQRGLLLLVMASYTARALYQLESSGWPEGSPLAGLAHLALACELLALPCTLFRPTQRLVWLVLLGVQVGVLLLGDASAIAWGTLLVHLLCLQPTWWLPPEGDAIPATLFFDGVCNLCDGAVRFVLAEDLAGRFRYAPLQGETAAQLPAAAAATAADLSTLVLQEGDRVSVRSDAVLRVGLGLGGIWHLLARVAWWVPRPLRDAAYGLVSRHRYRVFGKKDACRVPTPKERARFLP